MKEWCLQHPWMTFFIVNFAIWTVYKNIKSTLRGKKEFMENLDYKGVIKMQNNKGNGSSKGNQIGGSRKGQSIINERGSQTVTPSATSAPTPPPKQK